MITHFNHLTLAVRDIERSFGFYHRVLQFKPLCRWDKGAYFLVGDLWFCLNQDANRQPSPCYTHYAFSVQAKDFAAMTQRLKVAEVIIFKDNSSPGESVYFLDPDGHKLELHVGDWQTRLAAKKQSLGNWRNVEWFV